ncbi:TIGR03088 family PEP-CTERM/XrtA system glycosyltransferase [Colwellia ponticola]|uniref:TIGR03088 family PEP-CTERM/XrtA system glycosyltransferase n=1 Tax=Colwellia ponticola TaxID=2304625 RepID=A0A8H2PK29_9GAMM|nr:TIGR03088 family PEP-CTERM/XrtA system glycosyltransferase [Colwellia ponticola]TMM45261.1 TIGR03088 family PEP-CTERM/XrtA system glycosyltransferase [Colwellia ponticola]
MNKKSKFKHIAHVVHSFATGGLENGLVNLINSLPEDKYRHTIICVTSHDPKFYARINTNNIQIINLNKPQGKNIMWLYKCWRLLRTLKPDICHTRNLSAIEAQFPAFLARVPYRIHGEHGWDIFDIGGTNIKYQKVRKLFRPLIHKYVCLSFESIDYLINKINVKPSSIVHICNGVDVNKFTPKKPEVELPEHFGDTDKLVFGTVGRLAEVKNQTFLVKAFVKLWLENPHLQNKLRLIIVGDGVLLSKMKDIVEDAGANTAVWFAGQRNDICELMNTMDVFVLPSLAEGVPNTLLEAMSCGLPYIATSVGGNPDLIVSSHKDSHIVEVDNIDELTAAMSLYLDDPERLINDSKLVLEHCNKKFSIGIMVEKYHRLYQNSIN